jgi:hypothetical protein
MPSRPLSAGAALALCAALACAGPRAGPDRSAVLRTAHLHFPDDRFIVGYGEGDGPAAAEQAAQADAAAQIRSTIESNVSSSLYGVTSSGREQVSQEFLERTIVQVASDAGAFIRPRRELTKQAEDGRWSAVAVADRAELDAKYVDEARPLEVRFRELAARMKTARGWLDAARAWCDLKGVARAIDAKNVERYAVSRRWLWSEELQALRAESERAYQDAKASVRITVARPAEALATDPADAIVRRLSGWSIATESTPSCSGQGVVVSPTVDAQCRATQLGIVLCRASLRVEARACGAEGAIFSVTSARVEATDSREQDRARANALRRLGAEEVVAPAAKEAAGKLLTALGESCEG